jgi:hypothetical protein
MLKIDPIELANSFQRSGGTDWVDFMGNVLWAACWQVGVPESAVVTCLRTDIPDGGVDTQVSLGSGRDVTGYLKDPTVWQFKAAREANLRPGELVAEVNKPYARERILAGNAYRLCLCAQLPPDGRAELETALEAAVAAINPSAPQPKVLTVDVVARIAGHFPNLLQEFHGQFLQSKTLTFPTWSRKVIALTPTFVPGEAFEQVKLRVGKHIDPTTVPQQAVLSVRGMASIGKTRSVHEALKSFHASASLALYVDDGRQAEDVARLLANTDRMSGVLVVDDCSAQTRDYLNEALAGHRARVRVIAIQHDSDEDVTSSPELQLLRYSSDEIAAILLANFQGIARERLRAYIDLSDGYLRFAIDLCRSDHEIQQSQGIVPALPAIMSYYRNRLGSDADYVDSLGLFTRVGRHREQGAELDALCKWRGFDRGLFEQRCAELKESPGFVERTAVYYRIRPDIIAVHAFAAAWKKWAEGREKEFLRGVQALPTEMQKSFLDRVVKSGTPSAKTNVRNFFQSFASSLTGADLCDAEKVGRMIALVEVDPDHYLPQLRRLVVDASDAEIGVERRSFFGWGPRRQLVFAAENMAHFAAYFDDAERILFRLSQVEIEPGIGNNASGVWDRLFRPLYSGTPVPFPKRIALLGERLPPPDWPLGSAFKAALEKTFDYLGTGRVAPGILAGRIPEPQWRFGSETDRDESIVSCLRLLMQTAIRRQQAEDAHTTNLILVNAIDMFVREGFLDIVEREIRIENLPERVRANLHSRLDQYATRSGIYRRIPESKLSSDYAQSISTWIASFAPVTLLGRIIQAAGALSMRTGDELGGPLSPLAKEFLALYPSGSAEVLAVADWLYSGDVQGALQFGFQLGASDESGALLTYVFDRAVSSGKTEFARGYLSGSGYSNALNGPRLVELLDATEDEHPETAFSLSHAAAAVTDAFGRVLRLVAAGKLPPARLQNFTVWIGTRKTTHTDVERALDTLMPMVASGAQGTADLAVEFVAYQYYRTADPDWRAPEKESFDELAWQVVEAAIQDEYMHGHWWGEVVKALTPGLDPLRAARLLVRAMCCRNFNLRQRADELLGELAATSPQAAMEALGEMMLDEEMRLNFHVERFETFLALPPEAVGHWLDQHGVEGALTIARHIPAPYLDDDKNPQLHPLTELFLAKYAEDESAFNQYAGGLHSLQPYKGDIPAAKEEEAEVARKFLDHKLPQVRKWALYEIEAATGDAEQYRAIFDQQRK